MAQPATPSLSSTLQRVLREQTEPCDAHSLVLAILALHAEYASHRATTLGQRVIASSSWRVAPVATWYDDAREMLLPDLGKLSGRTAIVGLAMVDLAVGRELVRSGLFTRVLAELHEGVEVLSERGRRRLAQIPRATLGFDTAPFVLPPTEPRQIRGGIAFDGSRVIGYGDDADIGVELWNVESGRSIGRLGARTQSPAVRMARFSPEGASIVGLMRDGSVVRWPIMSFGEQPLVVAPPMHDVASGALSADASCAVNRFTSPAFSVLDLATGARTDVTTERSITRICVGADGSLVSIALGDQILVYRRTPADVSPVATYGVEGHIAALECGGNVVVSIANDRVHSQVVGDGPQDSPADTEPIDVRRPSRVAVSGDGSACAIVGADGVTVVEPVTGTVFGTLVAPVPAVRAVFSLDGQRLLVNYEDGSGRVWDVGLRPSGVRLPPARFDSDRADRPNDFLGRMHDVKAIASLIAATSVEPPLSIGIFGNWGSGKSWFMEQLHHEVSAISADALASRVPQSDLSFYKRIAQVKFNVWHYAEHDVLSSLVDHVFRRLDLGDRGDLYTDATRDAQRSVAEASKAEFDARAALAAAEQQLAELTAQRRAAEEDRASKAEQLRRTAELDAATRSTATAALNAFGWTTVGGATGDLVDALRENRLELERAGVLFAPLVCGTPREIRRRRYLAFASAALGPVLALVVGLLTAVWGDEATAFLASAGALLVGVLAGATKLIHDHTTFIRSGIDSLTDAERQIRDHVDGQLTELDETVATAQAAEIEKRNEIVSKIDALADAQQTLQSSATKLAEVTPERLLEELIDTRIASGDYAKQLGVIALARGDFEKVSSLVEAGNKRLLEKGATEQLDDDSGVNRIVLYIDDLDRCEPAKVARVLQAVHLLLAFPLFVVVVAVDPRWVGRALQREYPDLLDGSDVKPSEYLEKVFQIPFWLDRLDATRTTSMLAGLAQAGPRATSTERRARAGLPLESGADGGPAGGTHDGQLDRTPPAPQVGPAQAARSRELNPPALSLGQHEFEAMNALTPVLGSASPRALKRYVNIYRLCKVRAEDPSDFADPDRADSDYRAVLYLLAHATSDPKAARKLFADIRGAQPGDTVDLPQLPVGWSNDLATMKRWLGEVGRFSFEQVLAEPEPEQMAKTAEHSAEGASHGGS